jgi:FAD/FMN-containing dehydrogenase
MTTTASPLTDLAVRGELALAGTDRAAALAAPWNVATPVTPAAVVAAADAEDVAAAVRAAAASGLPVAVQATGHGGAAVGSDTLLVQTSQLSECTVHPEEGWVRIGAGVKWAAVQQVCSPYGLAPLVGSSSDVGAVGYTTGGGLGPIARTAGLTSDTVRALEVVTGDGELRRVTPESEPDLFWGLRGSKGALGIVTAVELDLLPIASVYGGALFFDGSDAPAVLHAWVDWAAQLPESVTTSVAVLQLPPMPGVPPQLAGRTTLAVRVAHVGFYADGEELVAPLRRLAPVLLDGVGPLPYAALDAVHTDPVDPMPAAEEAALLTALPHDAVDALLSVVGPGSGSPLVVAEVRQLGGAVAREPEHASAVCHRDAGFTLLGIGIGVPPFVDAVCERGAALLEAMTPWRHAGQLPNWGGGAAAYDAATLARLHRIADAVDPAGVLLEGRTRLGRPAA